MPQPTPPSVKTPLCDARFPSIADPPTPLTPNATTAKAASTASSTTCAVSAYRYSLLCQKAGFAYFELMPHRDEHAPVQCQLVDYPLLDSAKGTHPYEALSYVWGSEEKPRSVFTDKGCLRVTTNLHAARHALIMCYSGTIDGYAFCKGLKN
ncbi:hypothetical protein VTI74DRAFT_2229 [Chaetomium olivicolor]